MNRNITATILIIISIGMYFTVTTKIIASAKEVQVVNTKYKDAITSAEKLIEVRDQVLKDYNNLSQEDRVRLEKMIPRSVDNIRLVIDLNNLALQHGFNLKNIKATASKKDESKKSTTQASTAAVQDPAFGGGAVDPFAVTSVIPVLVLDSIAVSFSVDASYQQFISFLRDLEANLRIMDVTRLSATVNDNGVYSWSVELKTYWLRSQ
ncbi:MAG: hypothetical protein WC666_04560 [Candidatus Paceibacterota bacterium]|jgi:Tfp pilus assembly protein PilO